MVIGRGGAVHVAPGGAAAARGGGPGLAGYPQPALVVAAAAGRAANRPAAGPPAER